MRLKYILRTLNLGLEEAYKKFHKGRIAPSKGKKGHLLISRVEATFYSFVACFGYLGISLTYKLYRYPACNYAANRRTLRKIACPCVKSPLFLGIASEVGCISHTLSQVLFLSQAKRLLLFHTIGLV